MKSLISVALIVTIFTACTKTQVKVACIGDSITEGTGMLWESRNSYPVLLDNILGTGYTVLNCGRSTTTMLKESNLPYWNMKEIHNVFSFKPDIITIKLGTNDTKPFDWSASRFERDYRTLIDTLLTLPGPPKIYCCLPVPVFEDRWGINDSTLTTGVIPIIEKVAASYKLEVIDLYTPLLNQPENFPDRIHPNSRGALSIAKEIAERIASN